MEIKRDRWLTAAEAAEMLGVTLKAFYRRSKDVRKLTPIQLGNSAVRWSENEILELLKRRNGEAVEEPQETEEPVFVVNYEYPPNSNRQQRREEKPNPFMRRRFY